MRQVRKLRHWKQRFNENACFIWRRPTVFMGVPYNPGDKIPEELEQNKTKLRRFWESGRIELAEFDEPNVATGQVDDDPLKGLTVPEGVEVEKGKGTWYIVTVGDEEPVKLNGLKNVEAFFGQLEIAREIRAKLIDRAAALGVDLNDEILDEIDDDQRVQLETYLVALENEDEEVERPEFLPVGAEADDENGAGSETADDDQNPDEDDNGPPGPDGGDEPDDDERPLQGTESDDENPDEDDNESALENADNDDQ